MAVQSWSFWLLNLVKLVIFVLSSISILLMPLSASLGEAGFALLL